MPVQKPLKLLMIFEATGCYGEMTLTKFSFEIANNSESNMFQYGNPPLFNILSCQFRACLCRKIETTDDFWSSRALLWNHVKQILWDCQQVWIRHVPISENPLEYSILSISCMPVQKTLKLLMIFEATGCYCEMMLNKFCCGISNNSESNMLQSGNTPLNILSCQFRACLCRKTTDDFSSNRTPSQHARKNKETWWKREEKKERKNNEQWWTREKKQENMMKKSEKNNETWWKREKKTRKHYEN